MVKSCYHIYQTYSIECTLGVPKARCNSNGGRGSSRPDCLAFWYFKRFDHLLIICMIICLIYIFNTFQINAETIPFMDDTTLGKYLPVLGDRLMA